MMGRKDKKAFGAHYRGRDCMFHVKHSGTQIERAVAAAASVIDNARVGAIDEYVGKCRRPVRRFTWNISPDVKNE